MTEKLDQNQISDFGSCCHHHSHTQIWRCSAPSRGGGGICAPRNLVYSRIFSAYVKIWPKIFPRPPGFHRISAVAVAIIAKSHPTFLDAVSLLRHRVVRIVECRSAKICTLKMTPYHSLCFNTKKAASLTVRTT